MAPQNESASGLDSTESNDDDERTVCFCHNVSAKALKEAIRAGARTHADLQAATRASTGCGGCEFEVLDILEAETQKK